MKAKFNDSAETYAEFAIVQRRLAAWLAEWLEPPSRSADLSAVELGAGEGLFTRIVAPRFAHTTAVDIAPRMVEQGRRKLPRIQWCVGDGWHCDLKPVDRLFSASLLHWAEDPVAVLRHWRRLTKKGGHTLHGFYVAPTLVEWQLIAGAWSPIEWRPSSQWEEYFRHAGWTILRSDSHIHVELFSSALAVLRFFHRTGAVIPRQTAVGELRRMLADFRRTSASTKEPNGVTTNWTFHRIEAVHQ